MGRLLFEAGQSGAPRFLAALALICAVLALPTIGGAGSPEPGSAHAQSPVPVNDRIGLAFISSAELPDVPPQRYQQALNAGVRWNRWPIYWTEVARRGGYAAQDANAVRDHAYGLQIDAILLNTPDVYASGGGAGPEPRVGERASADASYLTAGAPPAAPSPPRNLNLPVFLPDGRINPENYWAAFVYATVNRYKPGGDLARQQGWNDGWGIRHWELWNEADSRQFWTGSVADYYLLLKVGYQAAKAADPQAKVLLSGLAYFENTSWFPQLIAEMERDPDQAARQRNNSYFDILPLHWYSQPALLYDKTLLFRQQLEAHGLTDKPIWVNETNVPVYGDPATPNHPSCVGYAHSANLQEQANFVIQALAYGFAAGVERIFVFQFYDDQNGEAFGLFRNNGEPRPAYNALQIAATYFRDARNVTRDTTGPVERIQFWGAQIGGALSRVAVAWARDPGSRTTWLNAVNGAATLLQRAGGGSPLGAANDRYIFSLPRATALDLCNDPTSGYIIGGDPSIVVEALPPDPMPPATTLAPLPGNVCDVAILRWSSRDQGWGVMSWDVEVRDLTTPDAPWRRWLTGADQLSAAYAGPAGRTYAFRVRARDYSGNAEPFPGDDNPNVARTTINACPPHIPGGGLIRNGSFEERDPKAEGPPGWGTAGSTGPRLVNDAHTGGWALALGQDFVGQPDPPMNGGGNSTASQAITVPANAPLPVLGYWYAIDSNAPAPAAGSDWHGWEARLEVIVIDAGGHPNYVNVYGTPTGWAYGRVDLAPWRGQQVSIVFNLWQASAAYTTVARLDDVSAWGDRRSFPFTGNAWPGTGARD